MTVPSNYAFKVLFNLLVLSVLVAGAHAASQTRAGTITSNSPLGGGDAWSNLNNALASDNAYASVTETIGGVLGTDHITVSGFGFTIPSGATIDGIVVQLEGHSVGSAVSPSVQATVSKDVAFAGFISVTFIGNAAAPGPPDSTQTQGTPTDFWSQSWTPAEINGSTFGTRIQALDAAFLGTMSSTYFLDDVQITVHYTPGIPPGAPASAWWGLGLVIVLLGMVGAYYLRKREA